MSWKAILGMFGVVIFYAVFDVLATHDIGVLWH